MNYRTFLSREADNKPDMESDFLEKLLTAVSRSRVEILENSKVEETELLGKCCWEFQPKAPSFHLLVRNGFSKKMFLGMSVISLSIDQNHTIQQLFSVDALGNERKLENDLIAKIASELNCNRRVQD